MSPLSFHPRVADYDAWYHTLRGRWIGQTEFALVKSLLRPERNCSLIDVGCGTGYFTRLFARELGGRVIGLDPDEEALRFARAHAAAGESYVRGRAEELPFEDGAFDFSISVAALCFVQEDRLAVREMLRVTRRRFALGLLNRNSLLWRRKGRNGSTGAYAGARWHTAAEARVLLEGLPVKGVQLRSAIVLPGGGRLARAVERIWPQRVLAGAFLCVTGEVAPVGPACD